MTATRVARIFVALACVAGFAGIVAVASVTMRAQSPRDAAGQPAAPSASRLFGRVIDATNGSQPVRRAIVTIVGDPLAAGRSAITDDEGRFAFEGVPAGTFTLTATRPGFLPSTFGALRAGRPGTPIRVRDGQPVPEVTMMLTHGSAVEGLLRDAANDPAPGMRVEAIGLIHGTTGDRGEVLGTAYTDDRGVYRIFDLPAGDYVLAATPAVIVGGMGDIGVPSEADVDAILAAVERRNTAAPPAPGAPPPAPIPPVKGYSTPATYYPGVVQSGDATRVALGPNEDRSELDFSVQFSHAASIDGTIVPVQGQPVPQVLISLLGGGPQLPVAGGGMSAGPALSMNPADHTFHYSNVPPGRYTLMARTLGAPGGPTAIASGGAMPRFDASAGVQWALTDVEIGNGDLAGISLVLRPALKVTGRIVFDGTSLQPPSDPTSIRLALEPVASDERSSSLGGVLTGVVHRDGTFEFPAVLPGLFRLTATAGGGWWTRSAIVEGHDALDGGLHVGITDLAGLTVTLSDRRAAIGGSLAAATGRPAPDYFMVAFAQDRALWRAPSRRIVSTRPATDGSFELRDLPPGAYYLAALTDVEPSDLDDPDFLASLVASSLRMTVEEGQRTTQNVRIGK